MNIETRYSRGDAVYVIHNNKVVYDIIDKIDIHVGKSIKTKYSILQLPSVSFEEDEIFNTRQELLDSL